ECESLTQAGFGDRVRVAKRERFAEKVDRMIVIVPVHVILANTGKQLRRLVFRHCRYLRRQSVRVHGFGPGTSGLHFRKTSVLARNLSRASRALGLCPARPALADVSLRRSEERRVGREGRSRWTVARAGTRRVAP